jgi:hypothetical protein
MASTNEILCATHARVKSKLAVAEEVDAGGRGPMIRRREGGTFSLTALAPPP